MNKTGILLGSLVVASSAAIAGITIDSSGVRPSADPVVDTTEDTVFGPKDQINPLAPPKPIAGESPLLPGFDELDSNADGSISKTEAGIDPKLSPRFAVLDKDGNGVLSRKEFAGTGINGPDSELEDAGNE